MRNSDPLSHVTHWSCDHAILIKSFISTFDRGLWSPILAKGDLTWVDHNHRVTWPIYNVITLYLQKGASQVSQRQWKSNLIELWVRVKGPHLLFQVTWRSSDHVLFEKHHVSTNTRPQNSARDIKHRKTHKSRTFLLFKRY